MRRLGFGLLVSAIACVVSGTAQAQMGTIRFDI